MWQGEDIAIYERLRQQALRVDKDIPALIKEIIAREISRNNND
ncbi:MAG: hypothetical protein VKL59_09170 [Nostocaceae cyanobacterium]|nr:hypothetical protein [Nostocaceae cyanobacterium]